MHILRNVCAFLSHAKLETWLVAQALPSLDSYECMCIVGNTHVFLWVHIPYRPNATFGAIIFLRETTCGFCAWKCLELRLNVYDHRQAHGHLIDLQIYTLVGNKDIKYHIIHNTTILAHEYKSFRWILAT